MAYPWLTPAQIASLQAKIEARKRLNQQTVLPIYSQGVDGIWRQTPREVLRTFPPSQLVHDEWGEIMTVREFLKRD